MDILTFLAMGSDKAGNLVFQAMNAIVRAEQRYLAAHKRRPSSAFQYAVENFEEEYNRELGSEFKLTPDYDETLKPKMDGVRVELHDDESQWPEYFTIPYILLSENALEDGVQESLFDAYVDEQIDKMRNRHSEVRSEGQIKRGLARALFFTLSDDAKAALVDYESANAATEDMQNYLRSIGLLAKYKGEVLPTDLASAVLRADNYKEPSAA